MPVAASQPLRMPHERRRFQRVAVDVLGRFMLEDRSEYPCRVSDMSPGDLAVVTVAPARLGERVVFYVDHLGRLEGSVRRLFTGGFAADIASTERKREKLAAQLTWLANRGELNLPEDRRHERVQPRNALTEVTLPDGRRYAARIVDLSLSGAALNAAVRPAVGTRVIVGRTAGRVVRHIEEGFAVEFAVIRTPESVSDI